MTFYLGQEQENLVIIPIVAVIYMGLLYLFVVSTFFLASFVDPGIYPRGKCCLAKLCDYVLKNLLTLTLSV